MQGLDVCDEGARRGKHLQKPHGAEALDDGGSGVVGGLEDTDDTSCHGGVIEVGSLGIVDVRLTLCGADNERTFLVGLLAHTDRANTPHRDGQHHSGEEDGVAKGHQRQRIIEGGLVDGFLIAIVFSHERKGILVI